MDYIERKIVFDFTPQYDGGFARIIVDTDEDKDCKVTTKMDIDTLENIDSQMTNEFKITGFDTRDIIEFRWTYIISLMAVTQAVSISCSDLMAISSKYVQNTPFVSEGTRQVINSLATGLGHDAPVTEIENLLIWVISKLER